jgi:hypothetical protein
MDKIIERGGVDPLRATGKRAVAWYVTKSMVPWALAHVINRHDLMLSETVVLSCAVHPRQRIRTNRRGIWCCSVLCPVDDIAYASDWLDYAELKIYIPSGHAKIGYRYGYQAI